MMRALGLGVFVGLSSLVACGGDGSSTTENGGAGGMGGSVTTGGQGGSPPEGGSGGTGGSGGSVQPPPMLQTISGDATWTVTFDATAQAAGATDCSYTRHYEGVEDRSAPWLCPACEILFLADVEVTSGLADCFPQVSTFDPPTQEWIGYGNGTWWRSAQGPTTAQGTTAVDVDGVSVVNMVTMVDAPVGGTLQFDVAGQYTFGMAEGDPLAGYVPPATYACGWPKADPPAYTGDYSITVGGTLPDGLFHDACGETVRLHDFAGSYLVVDMAAIDCPPCQTMASEEEAFVANMAAQGIDVKVVTLLAPSLSDVYGNTTTGMLNNWTNNFDLTSPVLGDRAWGMSVFGPAIGDTIGYPSFAVVAPDLTVLQFGSGYGGFADVETLITADAM